MIAEYVGMCLMLLCGAFHMAAVILLPYKLHTSRSAAERRRRPAQVIKSSTRLRVEIPGRRCAYVRWGIVVMRNVSLCDREETKAPARVRHTACIPLRPFVGTTAVAGTLCLDAKQVGSNT